MQRVKRKDGRWRKEEGAVKREIKEKGGGMKKLRRKGKMGVEERNGSGVGEKKRRGGKTRLGREEKLGELGEVG